MKYPIIQDYIPYVKLNKIQSMELSSITSPICRLAGTQIMNTVVITKSYGVLEGDTIDLAI